MHRTDDDHHPHPLLARHHLDDVSVVVAFAIVFDDIEAIGIEPALPARAGDLFALPERCETLPGDYETVRDYISGRATGTR